MRKVGIGLAVSGIVLSLLFADGVKFPTLERNIKLTKLGIDKLKENYISNRNKEIKAHFETNPNNSNNSDFILENDYNEPIQNNNQEEPNYSRIWEHMQVKFNMFADVVTRNGKIIGGVRNPWEGDIVIYGDRFDITHNNVVFKGDNIYKGRLVEKLDSGNNKWFKYKIIIEQDGDNRVNKEAILEYGRDSGHLCIMIKQGEKTTLFVIK